MCHLFCLGRASQVKANSQRNWVRIILMEAGVHMWVMINNGRDGFDLEQEFFLSFLTHLIKIFFVCVWKRNNKHEEKFDFLNCEYNISVKRENWWIIIWRWLGRSLILYSYFFFFLKTWNRIQPWYLNICKYTLVHCWRGSSSWIHLEKKHQHALKNLEFF